MGSPWKAAINRISASIIRSIYRHTRHAWKAVRYENKRILSRSEGRGGQLCAHCALHYAYLDSFPLIHRPCLGYGGWGNNTGRRRCKSLNEMEMDLEIRDKRISMGIEFIRFRCSYKSREEDVGEVSLRTEVVNSLKRLKFPLLFSFLSVFSFLRKKEGKRWMIEGRERKR